MNFKKAVIITLFFGVMLAVFIFDLGDFFSFEYLKQRQHDLMFYYGANRGLTVSIYFIIYIIVTMLSIPGATILTLAGGAIFGLFSGTIIISFASTIGASLAFLISRYLFRDFIKEKYQSRLSTVNRGMEEEGLFYLFTLRLIPIFPFFLINLVFGLTNISVKSFYWVSQIGMLAGTLVYVNAGTQLGQLESASGILSANILFAFALLGLFPIAAKKTIKYFRIERKIT